MKIDKLKHYFFGNLIAFITINSLSRVINPDYLFYGLVVGFFLFEVGQKVFKKGQFDLWDWFFGVLGAATIFGTAYIQL